MPIFTLNIFLSAFLLFLVQPFIGKILLPWFGGGSSVWSTVLLAFQFMLVFGYRYAAVIVRRSQQQRSISLHYYLMILACLSLFLTAFFSSAPLIPPDSLKLVSSDWPTLKILLLLLTFVGPSYLLLSSNSTLVQYWFSKTSNGNPYQLYAWSNAGSLLALLTYPIVFEPLFTLKQQSWIWSSLFGIFVCLTIKISSRAAHAASTAKPDSDVEKITLNPLWIGLSAVPTFLLIAVTTKITQEVAPVPFLWLIPLSLYLLSFIITFANDKNYNRSNYFKLTLLSTLVYLTLETNYALSMPAQVISYSLIFLIFCLVCHGELYKLRPAANLLDGFYFNTSIGGVIGGALASLVAPALFNNYYELSIGFCMFWIILIPALSHGMSLKRALGNPRVLIAGVVTLIGLFLLTQAAEYNSHLSSVRNFYGVTTVLKSGSEDDDTLRHNLFSGNTIHGFQYLDPEKSSIPSAYFSHSAGVGIAIEALQTQQTALKIGVVGLGIGTLAAYGRPQDSFDFYEINPQIIQIAQGSGNHFSYLKNCKARVRILEGDGRLLLEHETRENRVGDYDLLVIDAFSSDSIPMHLLTAEAMQLYLKAITPSGLLAVHITNRHLDLRPVLARQAVDASLEFLIIKDKRETEMVNPSIWVIMARQAEFLNSVRFAAQDSLDPDFHLADNNTAWTDSFSNILSILK